MTNTPCGVWQKPEDWHDDDGAVLWVNFEPDDPWIYEPYFGDPRMSDWDSTATYSHWMRLPEPPSFPA